MRSSRGCRGRRPSAPTSSRRTAESDRLVRRDPDSRTGFEFGYSGGGPTELAICILLDFFEVYEQAPNLPVNFYAFREAFIARADHDAERLEIDGSAPVAWMDAKRRREIRLAWRGRHVRWSLRRRHRPRRR